MKHVYWDTMIYAYWFEDEGGLGRRAEHIHSVMRQRGDILCSSLFILSELLVGPVKKGDTSSAQSIKEYFDSAEVKMLAFTHETVDLFAKLRASYGIKSFDALHLAIAATSRVDLFLTFDRRLNKLIMPGLPFIVSIDTDLF